MLQRKVEFRNQIRKNRNLMETVMNMTAAKEIRKDERNIKVMEDFTSPEHLYQELIVSVARDRKSTRLNSSH